METRFIPMSRSDFVNAVGAFPWKKPKTSVHVHHTWRPNHSQYNGLKTINAMWRYHTEKNGWSDIAQHVSIAPDGTIWSGRNWNADPASAAGYNSGAFMFETIGDFDAGRDILKGQQLESALTVTATILIAFGLQPWTAVRLHNQMSGKTCPGTTVNRNSFITAVSDKEKELKGGLKSFFSPRYVSTAAIEAVKHLEKAAEIDALGDDEINHDDIDADEYFGDVGAELTPLNIAVDQPRPTLITAEVNSLLDTKEEVLYAELATLSWLNGSPADSAKPLLGQDQIVALGRRIFERLHRELHSLLCGTAESDLDDRDKLRAAFGLGGDAVTAAIVGIMTASLAIAQPIAVVAAAIIVRKLLAPTYLETCAYWGENIK